MSREIYLSFAQNDWFYAERFKIAMAPIIQQFAVSIWQRGIIEDECILKEHLMLAHVFVALISAHYLTDHYCLMETQSAEYLQKRIIPILLRPCDYEHSRFSHLSYLPVKAVTQYRSADQAWLLVAQGMRKVLQS